MFGVPDCRLWESWQLKLGNWSSTVYGPPHSLVRNEFAGCRMRSRFWLGGVEDPQHRAASVPPSVAAGFVKRASE